VAPYLPKYSGMAPFSTVSSFFAFRLTLDTSKKIQEDSIEQMSKRDKTLISFLMSVMFFELDGNNNNLKL